jgi:hypothetical protein
MKGGWMVMSGLPIEPEFLQKRMMIPVKIAELTYFDQDAAIKFMRIWGEKKLPVTDIYESLLEELNPYESQIRKET